MILPPGKVNQENRQSRGLASSGDRTGSNSGRLKEAATVEVRKENDALWFRTTKNCDMRIGPLAMMADSENKKMELKKKELI